MQSRFFEAGFCIDKKSDLCYNNLEYIINNMLETFRS